MKKQGMKNKENWTSVTKGVYNYYGKYAVRPTVNGLRQIVTFTNLKEAKKFYNSTKA